MAKPVTRSEILSLLLLTFAMPAVATAQKECSALSSASLPHAKVVSAEIVAAATAAPATPAYCRVKGQSMPSADSTINFEVWLPISGWNGELLQLGSGGLAGSINYPPMMQQVRLNYAVAATDDGHTGTGTDGSWALGHPEKVKDFGYRAVHETAVNAKLLVNAFYGKAQKYAYFNGCSEGGREAIMEAQRFPEDFNGILAGAPAANWTGLMEGFTWNAQALLKDPASYIPEKKRPIIEEAVLKACGTQRGVTEPYVQDPLACRFDPAPLLCKDKDSDSCLTAPQLTALKKIYAGAFDSKTGKRLYPGYESGPEAEPGPPGLSYSSYIYGPQAPMTLDLIFTSTFLGNAVYKDPKYSSLAFDFSKDPATVSQAVAADLDATDPNLKPFKEHGGKLIHYHGWYDGSPAPRSSVDYYRNVLGTMGSLSGTQDFYRLFMVPGMMHCGLGPGPNSFGNMTDTSGAMDPEHNIFSALQAWVEKDRQPDSIIATKFPGDDSTKPPAMTRPLCPFPQQAVWDGKGPTSEAASFSCAAGK